VMVVVTGLHDLVVSRLAGTTLDAARAVALAADNSLPVPVGADAVVAALRDGWTAAAQGGAS